VGVFSAFFITAYFFMTAYKRLELSCVSFDNHIAAFELFRENPVFANFETIKSFYCQSV
jgi:hypothetical protein